MDTRGDVVQLLVKKRLECHATLFWWQLLILEKCLFGRFFRRSRLENGIHRSNSCPARNQRMSWATFGPEIDVWSNFWISAMIRSVSAGLVCVM